MSNEKKATSASRTKKTGSFLEGSGSSSLKDKGIGFLKKAIDESVDTAIKVKDKANLDILKDSTTSIKSEIQKRVSVTSDVIDNTAVMNITRRVVNGTITNAISRAKTATKNIILGLVVLWIVWLIISIVLVAAYGGWIVWLVVAISFITMLVFCVIYTPIRIKATTVKIAMAVPADLAHYITIELKKFIPEMLDGRLGIEADLTNSILNKVNESMKDSYSLLRNPKKTIELTKEIQEVVIVILSKNNCVSSEDKNENAVFSM